MFMRLDLGGWALLLMAMGLAYLVCLRASKEGSKLFKIGGYAIGIIILAASLTLAICGLKNQVTSRRRRPAARGTRNMGARPTTKRATKRPEIPRIPRMPIIQQGKTAPEAK